jgi:hypothetical protein
MSTQAAFFGQQPPPPIKKANTASSTTTESSNSKTKNGIKTVTTKYITTTREATSAPDQDTNTLNKETRTYNDGTTDDITLTRKVLGGMQYDIETIVRTTTQDTGSKKTKTTYSTPYQELDPVTGQPIAAFNRVTHTGADHAMAPPELAAQIAQRAPAISDKSHNVTPVTTGPGAPPAPSTTVTSSSAAAASSSGPLTSSPAVAPSGGGASEPVPSGPIVSSVGGDPAAIGSGAPTAPAPASATTTTTPTTTGKAPDETKTTVTTTTVVEEGGGCCGIM